MTPEAFDAEVMRLFHIWRDAEDARYAAMDVLRTARITEAQEVALAAGDKPPATIEDAVAYVGEDYVPRFGGPILLAVSVVQKAMAEHAECQAQYEKFLNSMKELVEWPK